LVRFEGRLLGIGGADVVADGEVAREDDAGGRVQRHQVGLGDGSGEVIGGEKLSADKHFDLVLAALQLDAGRGQGSSEQDDESGKSGNAKSAMLHVWERAHDVSLQTNCHHSTSVGGAVRSGPEGYGRGTCWGRTGQ